MNPAVNELDRLTKAFKIVLGIIVTLGVIMVYSSSYIFAKEVFGNSAHFFFRQLIFLAFSLGMVLVISKTKYKFWLKFSLWINFAVTILLALTFIPGIGLIVKGANRWINLGPVGFQPGEVVKYTLLLTSLHFFENFQSLDKNQRIINGISMLAPLVLLLGQPDFGTFAVSFAVMAFACFMSSFPRKYFYSGFFVGLVLGVAILFAQPYRVRRLLTFLDPWQNPRGSGFQIIQSYLGFAGGSIWGRGIGNSNEKLFYLPEAHNDFIFSVIGEELGFIGIFFFIALFLALIFLGFKLALKVKDRIGALLVSTLVFTLGLQVVLNMGVVLGLLPTKGLNLPFVSYGGSSLIANFFGIGLIMAVMKACRDQMEHPFSSSGYGSSSSSFGGGMEDLSSQGDPLSRFQSPPAANEFREPPQRPRSFTSEHFRRPSSTPSHARPSSTPSHARPSVDRLKDPRRLP